MLPEISDLSTAIDCSSLSFVPCICCISQHLYNQYIDTLYIGYLYNISAVYICQSFLQFFSLRSFNLLNAESVSFKKIRRTAATIRTYFGILDCGICLSTVLTYCHAGMISVLNSESFKSPDFFLAYPQQSVRYSGTTPLTSPISQVTDLISVFFIKM